MIHAKIICDSISQEGIRLTTFQLRYPKFIHSEFMTHRVFSRNASSSRAIPVYKLVGEAGDPDVMAAPVFWGKNQKGMQADEELSRIAEDGEVQSDYDYARSLWEKAGVQAAQIATVLHSLGAHKQIVNRLLEPFTHINVLVTATEYMNFFGLRLDKAAQPEMRALADAMYYEYENHSLLKSLRSGEWHLPYIDIEDREQADLETLQKLSVARCARVSYKSFETGMKPDFDEDMALYNRLVGSKPIHASPAEHQATPDIRGMSFGRWVNQELHGNFNGWIQYRKMLPGESMAELPEEYRV